jgi:hypothetical protein
MAELPDKDKLLRNFGRCANWEEKYLYIIELGQRLPPLGEEAHNPENIIQGCQSQVWIVMAQSDDGTIELRGDSDAAIVKGLLRSSLFFTTRCRRRILSRSMSARGLKKWPDPTPHPVPLSGTGSDDSRDSRQSCNP